MKTFAIALVALLLVGGAVPMALAQQDNQSQAPAPQSAPSGPASPGAPSGGDMKAPSASGGVDARGGISADVQIKRDRSEDAAGAASPRTTEVTRTGFFGLSPTAAIIVSVAVLLVVILAIVAMTNNTRGTTYIDRDRGL